MEKRDIVYIFLLGVSGIGVGVGVEGNEPRQKTAGLDSGPSGIGLGCA